MLYIFRNLRTRFTPLTTYWVNIRGMLLPTLIGRVNKLNKIKLNIDEVGVKYNNAIDNVHKEEEKDSKSEHRFYFELSTFK